MHLIPRAACEAEAKALGHGAEKYGSWNWRKSPVRVTVYVGAMMRHLLAWMDGEDNDPDSGLSHVAHIRANTAVVLDAASNGVLIDDRPQRGGDAPCRASVNASDDSPTCYIAGPMRNKPNWNAEAFAHATRRAQQLGWRVINPIELDQAAGIDLNAMDPTEPVSPEMMRDIVQRDVKALCSLRAERGDVLVLLNGWQSSNGAYAESAVSHWLGIPSTHIDLLTKAKRKTK